MHLSKGTALPALGNPTQEGASSGAALSRFRTPCKQLGTGCRTVCVQRGCRSHNCIGPEIVERLAFATLSPTGGLDTPVDGWHTCSDATLGTCVTGLTAKAEDQEDWAGSGPQQRVTIIFD